MRRLLFIILLYSALVGCSTAPRGPYSPLTETARNSLKAERLNREAVDLMHNDPPQAELLLREALTADLWHGPSHNSLGVLALRRGDLYTAANEFEWARKLMPGHPDPRMNLALTLERAGRIDDALAAYESALEVYPNHLPTIQAITRLQVRHRRTDERTPAWLHDIALRSDKEWRTWARRLLSH